MNQDKFALYLNSVQTPAEDAKFLSRRFTKLTGRPLRLLREDFCGTANLLCEFVKLHEQNAGIGIDLDEKPLRWCRNRNFQELAPDQRNRVVLHQSDVLEAPNDPVDMVVALNYSYSVFHTRSQLLRYFNSVRNALVPDGVFLLDVHGGSSVPIEDQEAWDLGEFQ